MNAAKHVAVSHKSVVLDGRTLHEGRTDTHGEAQMHRSAICEAACSLCIIPHASEHDSALTWHEVGAKSINPGSHNKALKWVFWQQRIVTICILQPLVAQEGLCDDTPLARGVQAHNGRDEAGRIDVQEPLWLVVELVAQVA